MTSQDTDYSIEAEAVGQHVVVAYLQEILSIFNDINIEKNLHFSLTAGKVPDAVFSILTHRKFCYLSRHQSAKYSSSVINALMPAISKSEPLQFYYDIGGGYHASLQPGKKELVFTVGLGELLILSQIVVLSEKIRKVYPSGIRFYLVIDNLCAYFVNNISIESTTGYCNLLRELIFELGLTDSIDVLVESEQFSVSDYKKNLRKIDQKTIISPTDDMNIVDNVARFLGRKCSEHEAAERIKKYREVTDISEYHLATVIDGVRMTQRATEKTLCFRSFPGGDSRMQAGLVALSQNAKGRIHPVLLTSRNIEKYVLSYLRFSDSLLPSKIEYVIYAEANKNLMSAS